LELERIRAAGFRNLVDAPVELGSGATLVVGSNGAGKTSLLEAVAVLGNLRSFRTSHLRRAAAHGRDGFLLEGLLRRGGRTVRIAQQVDLGPPLRRSLSVDGADADVGLYLQQLPVFTLTPDDRELVLGPPGRRRAFLDRTAFLLDARVLDLVRDYRRALRQRNAALAAAAPDPALEPWDAALAAAGAAVVRHRAELVRRLRAPFTELLEAIADGAAGAIELAYRGDAEAAVEGGPEELEIAYRARYNETRARDRQAGFTVDGPHRHEMGLRVDGRPVRDVLSSGQTKVMAAALRLAALALVEAARGDRVPIVIDDVDAELDMTRLDRLVARLGSGRQLLMSSAHEELVVARFGDATRLTMEHGACVRRER